MNVALMFDCEKGGGAIWDITCDARKVAAVYRAHSVE